MRQHHPRPVPRPVPRPSPTPSPSPEATPPPTPKETKITFASNNSPVDLVADPAGMPLHPNPFLENLKKLQPSIFKTEGKGNILSYSRGCPWNTRRQPVIISKEQKENIDKNHRDSYTTALEYSPGNTDYWYICPRFWSLRDNISLSEEDVKNIEKYGKIIPTNPPGNKVPEGGTIFEFNEKKYHRDAEGNYKYLHPGFLKKKNSNGLCVPCCFSRWDTKKQKETEESCRMTNKDVSNPDPPMLNRQTSDTDNYIKGADKFPLEPNRWGYLNVSLQRFLQTDNQKCYISKSSTKLRANHPCMVRRGVELNKYQSFIATIADVFVEVIREDNVPSIREMKNIIIAAITLDLFITYHNGDLVTLFEPKSQPVIDIDKYKSSRIYQEWEKQGTQGTQGYIVKIAASYENFIKFLSNDKIKIDETYLWDIICKPNLKLFPKGINLVIIETLNNDITDNISVKCPSNHYSSEFFDNNKKTLILYQIDEYYEPIYLLEDKTDRFQVTRMFNLKSSGILPNVKSFLELIRTSLNNKCAPLASLPRVYKFKKNLLLINVVSILLKQNYEIKEQVLNYESQVIGLIIEKSGEQGFIPIAPSSIIIDLTPNYKWMDGDDLWDTYENTVNFLSKIAQETELPTMPKLKMLEDGMIVGILTETNQFVAISQPVQDIYGEDLPSVDNMNYNQADITTAETGYDLDRIKYVKNIKLETNFFNVFRNTVRILFGKYKYKPIRETIEAIIANKELTYNEKLTNSVHALKELLHDNVVFSKYDKDILEKLTTIASCVSVEGCESKRYCLLSQGTQCKLIIPKNNLINDMDNEKMYFGRMADELLRYNRINQFIFQPRNFLTFSELNYNLNDDEIILLQSLLTQKYFEDLVPQEENKYIHQNTHDTAMPLKTQVYSDEVDVANLEIIEEKTVETPTNDCPAPNKKDLSHKWKPEFGKYFFELEFDNSPEICTFNIILTIIKIHDQNDDYTIQYLKEQLVLEYNKYKESEQNILLILKNQGKSKMIQNVIKNNTDLDVLIMGEDYYLTNLDILMLASRFKIPFVFYSGTMLKETNQPILIFNPGKTKSEAYYFIKSPGILPNKKPKYRLIIRSKKNKIFIPISMLNVPSSPTAINLRENITSGEGFDLNNYITTYVPEKMKKRRLILNNGDG